jgi:hypothetical protein
MNALLFINFFATYLNDTLVELVRKCDEAEGSNRANECDKEKSND